MTTGNLLVSESNVTLGNVSNLHISGGNSGYILSTNGANSLSWVDPASTQSPAPMPLTVDTGNTLTISSNYQGLYGTPITIDGTLVIDGVLVDVSGQGAPGTDTQISFNDEGSPGANNGFTFNPTSGNMAVPGNVSIAGGILGFTTISKASLLAITGSIGQLAVLTNSSPAGQLVYWDATNNRWAYVSDNSAVI